MAARLVAIIAALALFAAPMAVNAQELSTVTTTTSTVPDAALIYGKYVKEMPKFCKKKKSAQLHCAIAPVLFEAGQTWEKRANDQLVDTRRCNKDLTACENTLGEEPMPAETDGPDLGVVGQVLIYVGVAALAAGAAGTVGYFMGKADR